MDHLEKYREEERNNNAGEWKTINGAHIFIKSGQSIESALGGSKNDKSKSYYNDSSVDEIERERRQDFKQRTLARWSFLNDEDVMRLDQEEDDGTSNDDIYKKIAEHKSKQGK